MKKCEEEWRRDGGRETIRQREDIGGERHHDRETLEEERLKERKYRKIKKINNKEK